MPVVPISRQPRRQQQAQPIADPKFLMMAAALMQNEGKFQPQPQSDSSAAVQSMQPQPALR